MSARSRLRTYIERLPPVTPRAVLVAGAVLACLLATAGVGPWSPTALDRVDAALLRGDTQGALASCDRVARFGLTDTLRDRAAYRCALLLSAQPVQQDAVAKRLRRLLRSGVGDPLVKGLSLALLAQTLESQGHHLRAARRYDQLARVAPAPEPWLEASARAWERVGRTDRALLRQAQVATDGTGRRAEALLAMGRLSLGQGRTDRAYAHYAAALEAQPSQEQRRLARLGMAMALDAMGRFDLALAELDEAAPHGDRAIGIARDRVARRAVEEHPAP